MNHKLDCKNLKKNKYMLKKVQLKALSIFPH